MGSGAGRGEGGASGRGICDGSGAGDGGVGIGGISCGDGWGASEGMVVWFMRPFLRQPARLSVLWRTAEQQRRFYAKTWAKKNKAAFTMANTTP